MSSSIEWVERKMFDAVVPSDTDVPEVLHLPDGTTLKRDHDSLIHENEVGFAYRDNDNVIWMLSAYAVMGDDQWSIEQRNEAFA
jgi:hypothetical protein